MAAWRPTTSLVQVFEDKLEADQSLMGKLMGGQVNRRSANLRIALKRDLAETLKVYEDVPAVAPAPSRVVGLDTRPRVPPAFVEPADARTAGPVGTSQSHQPIRKPASVAYVRRYRHPALSRPVRKVVPLLRPTGLRAEADQVLAFVMRSFAVPELAGLIIKLALVAGATIDALRAALGDIEWRPAASPFGPRGRNDTNVLSGR